MWSGKETPRNSYNAADETFELLNPRELGTVPTLDPSRSTNESGNYDIFLEISHARWYWYKVGRQVGKRLAIVTKERKTCCVSLDRDSKEALRNVALQLPRGKIRQ